MKLIQLSEEARKDGIEKGENWLKEIEDNNNRYEITDYCNEAINDGNEVEDEKIKKLLKPVQIAEKKRGTSVERLKNAFNLTDMEKTIENGGAHKDGTPKLALATVGDQQANCTISSKEEKLNMGRIRNIPWMHLRSIMAAEKHLDKKFQFWAVFALIIGITLLTFACLFGVEGKPLLIQDNEFLDSLVFVLMIASLTFGFFGTIGHSFSFDSHSKSLACDVPIIPKVVLERIKGEGPFYTLFETEKGWERASTDPVIFRLIIVNGKDYWEPQRGWNMTALEKESMVPLIM